MLVSKPAARSPGPVHRDSLSFVHSISTEDAEYNVTCFRHAAPPDVALKGGAFFTKPKNYLNYFGLCTQ